MPKKKGEYSVLSEVNTEDEWLQLCKKEVSGARGLFKRSSRLIEYRCRQKLESLLWIKLLSSLVNKYLNRYY